MTPSLQQWAETAWRMARIVDREVARGLTRETARVLLDELSPLWHGAPPHPSVRRVLGRAIDRLSHGVHEIRERSASS